MSELANAWSMLLPLGTCAYIVTFPSNLRVGMYAAGVGLLCVNSFAYHYACSRKRLDCALSLARKLDQTTQHVTNVLFVCAISDSAVYKGAVAGYATGAATMLWVAGRHDRKLVRRANLLVTSCMVLGSMAWRRDYANLCKAAGYVMAAMGFFTLGGYWHALSHVLLAPYIFYVHAAIGSTDTS